MRISSPTEPDRAALIASGRRTVTREAAALGQLAEALGAEFAQAAATLLACRGRVVVSGMGKSGHVARKIAATLASTGTPAQFVHPGEASHGDLGMVTPEDVALVLSNSGETPELGDLVAHTRRFGVPLIAIAGKAAATLPQAADIALILPPVAEACVTGMVPTTSTTMALALGDALAVALMESRQFTPEQFRVFHPGGKLGARLLRVGDLMHRGDQVPLVPSATEMGQAIVIMSEKGFGVVGVTDPGGRLAGIVTDGDLRRHMGPDLTARPVDQVMTANPETIAPEALAAEALRRMQGRITCLFVVDGAGVAGIVRLHDCLVAGVA